MTTKTSEIINYEKEISSYPHVPLGVFRNSGIWPTPKYEFSLVACARWEARYISEWLSYHRSIGFEHVYLYCNDDDPSELFQAVMPFVDGPAPFVTFIHYPFPGLQYQMYFHFCRNFMPETKWMMLLDIDEFVCIRTTENLPAFVSRLPKDMDALYLNWSSFGHNGHETRPPGSVMLNYTRREDGISPFTKVLLRSERFPYSAFFKNKTFCIMHDYLGLDDTLIVYNVLGEQLTDYYTEFPRHAWPFLHNDNRCSRILDVAFIAHYTIKSNEDFDLRVRRGLHGDYDAEKMWGEKTKAERHQHHLETNAVEDTFLHDYWKNYLATRAWMTSPFPPPRWPLISTGSKTLQSSTAHSGGAAEDSRNLINRRPVGGSQAHTDLETSPWWQIDFGRDVDIHEIRLFNRLDGVLERMNHFILMVSGNDGTWTEFFVRTDDHVFGGIDGTPFIWTSETGIRGRQLRIVCPGESRFFHLDQAEVYGCDADGCGGVPVQR